MRRALKISVWSCGALLLLVIALLGAVLTIGNTQSGRALIVRLTSRLTHGHVELSGIGGSFPSALDLDRLQLSDDRGVWLAAEHISLRWSPMALVGRHVQIDTLHVGRLHIERAPERKPEAKPSGGNPISFPTSDLHHLAIDTLELSPHLAGTAVSLVLHGSAHWRSMQDASANLSVQRTGGVGNYDAQLSFNADRMDATLKLHEPANGPLENLLRIPGLGDLSVLAQLSGPRTAESLQLTLDAGTLRGRINGVLNLRAVSADLDYTLTAGEMTPRPGLSWQKVDIQGRWHGTVRSPSADGHLLIEQLQIPDGIRMASLAANLTGDRGLLSTRATLEGLVISGSRPALFQDAPLTLDATAHLSDPKRPVDLTASHKLFGLQAHVTTAGQYSGQLELHLPDVSPFAALADQKIGGDATLKAQITQDGSSTRLTADATAKLDGSTASWAGLFRGDNARLQLAGALTEKKISVDKLELTGHAITLGASGSMARTAKQDLDARLNISLSDLAQLTPTLDGSMKLSGQVKGPRASLSTVADVTSTLSIRGSPKGTVSASVNADGIPNAPHGTVDAHGDMDGAPLHLEVSLERDKGDLVHAIIRHADWKSAHIEGDLASGAEIARARGNLRLTMTQLADLDRLLGSTLRGSLSGNVKLTPTTSASRAHIDLEANDVVTGGITSNTKLTANGSMDALAVQLDAQSPAIGGKPAAVTASANLNLAAHELELNAMEAHYQGQTVQLLNPATLSFAEGLSVRQLRLGARQAVLEVDGRYSPTLDIRVSLQQLKPELINAFVPGLLAGGIIRANAQVQGSAAAPTGELHLDATGLRGANAAARGLPAVDMHADARLMGDTALIDAKLNAGSASHLTLNGHAPIAASGALDLKLGGNLDVALLNPLTEASGRHVEGTLTIDTTITGTPTAPAIGGSVRLADGNLRDYTQGVNLTSITGELTGGGHGTLQIHKLTARASTGDVSLTGTIGVLEPGIPVDIKLTAKGAQPIASNIVTANVDADILVSGAVREKLDVSGKINIKRANVQIPSSFPPNVAILDVHRPGQVEKPPVEKPLVIGLDIRVNAPRQILVKGRGLDAELGGEIHVRGTANEPLVTGSFDLQRGTFALGNGQLTFTQGNVTFNGAGLKHKIDPTLDFVAQSQVADVTIIVKITGLADAPKIELSSTPELPQDEIMARLLFGESASQLSGLQVVQIGTALAQLSGSGGGGLNPLDKLQKTLGLDRLTVGTGPSTGTGTGTANDPQNAQNQNLGYSVEAGRYVSSRVFVTVKQSTTGFSQVGVSVDLTKHLKLQTRVGNGTAAQGTTPENDPGSNVGIAYQFEY